MAKKLTKKEEAWIKRMQKLLDQCPKRFGFYTIGDPQITIYERNMTDAVHEMLDSGEAGDFGPAVYELDAELGELIFPTEVHSTAG